ncbi:hypothetical protein PCNPT3_12145 [Psychromonas sp. CNPT3]|uniref:ABC transporter permease n=1 Tax=Psychromonas sp. CNPT3 TaxID=314282 RepID=UPI00006E9E48|nr:ABC transporter permease [Psychromonas sp. CNPT3]AGH82365.1 hypothetical protein PCNPT3_12145 [Psychromonas sp. CNPT3]
MFLLCLKQSLWRGRNRKILSIFTFFLSAALLSALFAVSINIGDKMAREMKSYGANILIQSASESLAMHVNGINYNPLSGQSFLDARELRKIKGIFWRNNIIGFAPKLHARVSLKSAQKTLPNIGLLGTYFNKKIGVDDEPNYHTGMQIIAPFWEIQGRWPDDSKINEVLVGAEIAKRYAISINSELNIVYKQQQYPVYVSGIVTTGGEEDSQIIATLALVQKILNLPGKMQQVQVSALTVPENALSKAARKDLAGLNSADYDKWYCTAYVSAIALQLEEAMSGALVQPIWQVAASEGLVIEKLQLLLLVVTIAAFIAAGLGIASLMTTTIIERAAEIGLMKSLGATNSEIHGLFYCEAMICSLIGASLGCVAGALLARIIGWSLFNSPLEFSWIVVPVVIVVSLLIALFGSFFPAKNITKLYPVEVLHGQ